MARLPSLARHLSEGAVATSAYYIACFRAAVDPYSHFPPPRNQFRRPTRPLPAAGSRPIYLMDFRCFYPLPLLPSDLPSENRGAQKGKSPMGGKGEGEGEDKTPFFAKRQYQSSAKTKAIASYISTQVYLAIPIDRFFASVAPISGEKLLRSRNWRRCPQTHLGGRGKGMGPPSPILRPRYRESSLIARKCYPSSVDLLSSLSPAEKKV